MSLDLIQPTTTARPVVLRQVPQQDRVLTPAALVFLTELQIRFGHKLNALMVARERRQERLDQGRMPDYLEETKDIRKGIWSAAPLPSVLTDRRTEVTAPVERGAMLAALGSGARVFTADFEDATAPSFTNIIAGHANLLDHRDGPLDQIGADPALLIVRPRGLHATEANVMIAGHGMSAALFDFGVDIFHNGRALAATGRGPFYALPKIEGHREARFWNEVFNFAERRTGLTTGTIKATVTMETLTAAYEMDEIVWELRDHIAAMALSRANYIASYIRAMRTQSDRVLPADLPADRAFIATCAARLVKVCHRRGILAIGDHEADYEARCGFDGSAGPVAATKAVYDDEMTGPNQLRVPRQGWRIEPEMLLKPHEGRIPEHALTQAISRGIDGLARWLSGKSGDIAQVELARMQVWQWLRFGADVDGRTLTADWLAEALQAEIVSLIDRMGANAFHRAHYASAARIFQDAVTAQTPPDFITTRAYPVLNALD